MQELLEAEAHDDRIRQDRTARSAQQQSRDSKKRTADQEQGQQGLEGCQGFPQGGSHGAALVNRAPSGPGQHDAQGNNAESREAGVRRKRRKQEMGS